MCVCLYRRIFAALVGLSNLSVAWLLNTRGSRWAFVKWLSCSFVPQLQRAVWWSTVLQLLNVKGYQRKGRGVNCGNGLTAGVRLSLFTKADFIVLVHMYYISTPIEINFDSFLLILTVLSILDNVFIVFKRLNIISWRCYTPRAWTNSDLVARWSCRWQQNSELNKGPLPLILAYNNRYH